MDVSTTFQGLSLEDFLTSESSDEDEQIPEKDKEFTNSQEELNDRVRKWRQDLMKTEELSH